MVKTRNFFFLMDYFTVKQRAGHRLSHARATYKDPTDDLGRNVPLGVSLVAQDRDSAHSIFDVGLARTNAPSVVEELSSFEPTLPALGTSVATPKNTTDTEALKSVICHERVMTPSWYYIDCYNYDGMETSPVTD